MGLAPVCDLGLWMDGTGTIAATDWSFCRSTAVTAKLFCG